MRVSTSKGNEKNQFLKHFQSLHSKYLGVNNPIVQCLYLEKGLFTVFCQEFDVK